LADERNFDEVNLGRTATDVLAELQSLPPLPLVSRFTHADACLPNFLTQDGLLTGIVDLGGAGVAHGRVRQSSIRPDLLPRRPGVTAHP